MQTCLHCPMSFVKTLKPRLCVGALDLPERRKRHTSSREGEEGGEVDAQMRLSGEAIESRSHIVGGCEMDKEERDAFEGEMRKKEGCDMEKFCTLHSREKNDRYSRR